MLGYKSNQEWVDASSENRETLKPCEKCNSIGNLQYLLNVFMVIQYIQSQRYLFKDPF